MHKAAPALIMRFTSTEEIQGATKQQEPSEPVFFELWPGCVACFDPSAHKHTIFPLHPIAWWHPCPGDTARVCPGALQPNSESMHQAGLQTVLPWSIQTQLKDGTKLRFHKGSLAPGGQKDSRLAIESLRMRELRIRSQASCNTKSATVWVLCKHTGKWLLSQAVRQNMAKSISLKEVSRK